MHTKHSHLSKIRTAATILCAALFLCTCSYERIPDDGDNNGQDDEYTTVTLKVATASNEHTLSTKGLTADEENAINNLYILAFQLDKNDNLTYRLKYFATGTPVIGSGSGDFTFTLRCSVSGADTKLLLVANQNPFSKVQMGMAYNDVQGVLTNGELGTALAFADTGIPMIGFAGDSSDSPLEIKHNMTPPTAHLLRAVARVDVGVGTYNKDYDVWDKGSVSFNLTHVYVYKPQDRYALLPQTVKYNMQIPYVDTASPAGSVSAHNFEYTGAAITSDTYCKSEIYIPEFAFGGGKVYDTNHEKRMALVIGGDYKGTTYFYRIDFTDQPTNVAGTELQDVLRNKIYRFTITNVSLPGYTTADAAYSGKPVGLSFTTSVIPWQDGASGSPNPDMLVRMNFNGINGTKTNGRMTDKVTNLPVDITIKEKTPYFMTDDWREKGMLHYNDLLGEVADNTYNGTGNGGWYTGPQDACNREGPYAKLVIAPDNAAENVQWRETLQGAPRKSRVLNAQKACWDYRGQGRSDWRLPRLSELCLLWLNKEAINQSKGFTSLGVTTQAYWTGTEGNQKGDDRAYAVNARGEISLNSKTDRFSIRCVREVR